MSYLSCHIYHPNIILHTKSLMCTELHHTHLLLICDDFSTKKAAVTKVKAKTTCQFQDMGLSYFINKSVEPIHLKL